MASLLISGGAVLTSTGYTAAGGYSPINATIGNAAGASGQAIVTGAGSAWNSGGNALIVGNSGTGELAVENDGMTGTLTLTANDVPSIAGACSITLVSINCFVRTSHRRASTARRAWIAALSLRRSGAGSMG